MPDLATTPPAPYYAVIFTTVRSADPDGAGAVDLDGYEDTAARMEALAAAQPGYLGIDSARSDIGITVSYWADEASIRSWRDDAQHTLARETGRRRWYDRYELRVARVERAYGWSRQPG